MFAYVHVLVNASFVGGASFDDTDKGFFVCFVCFVCFVLNIGGRIIQAREAPNGVSGALPQQKYLHQTIAFRCIEVNVFT